MQQLLLLLHQRDEGIARCKGVSGLPSPGRSASSSMSGSSVAPKVPASSGLSQQVLKIETESPPSAAFCFHPFKALLTTVDLRGVVRVLSYQSMQASDAKQTLDARSIVNRFHIARGAPAHPSALHKQIVPIYCMHWHVNMEVRVFYTSEAQLYYSIRLWLLIMQVTPRMEHVQRCVWCHFIT